MIPNEPQEPKMTPELVAEHGLKPEEYERILALIGREPTYTELGIFSAMWNEHCSYKSSKVHLRTLPTKAPWVIQGPGENAGVIDIGDGLACVFKMESHNHPSFIEPYQGAANGRRRHPARRVHHGRAADRLPQRALASARPTIPRRGIWWPASSPASAATAIRFGVPTVGGSVGFHTRYDGNNLVNAMAVGIAETDKIFYAKATGVGRPIVYLGSKTGRDGITAPPWRRRNSRTPRRSARPCRSAIPSPKSCCSKPASRSWPRAASSPSRTWAPRASPAPRSRWAPRAISASTLDLDKVPCREEGMSAYEMMLSEARSACSWCSSPRRRQEAEAIFRKWGLDFAVVGETTDTKRFVVAMAARSWPTCRSRNSATRRRNMTRPYSEPKKLPVIDARHRSLPDDSLADALSNSSARPTFAPSAGSGSSTTT
jgi:phosphoribosylformylglycinamidine synthase subunit PurL